MKNTIEIISTTGTKFRFYFFNYLKKEGGIPTITEVYQVTGDLPCNILDTFSDGENNLSVIFHDLYKNEFRVTIRKDSRYNMKTEVRDYSLTVNLEEKREWLKIGCAEVKL